MKIKLSLKIETLFLNMKGVILLLIIFFSLSPQADVPFYAVMNLSTGVPRVALTHTFYFRPAFHLKISTKLSYCIKCLMGCALCACLKLQNQVFAYHPFRMFDHEILYCLRPRHTYKQKSLDADLRCIAKWDFYLLDLLHYIPFNI